MQLDKAQMNTLGDEPSDLYYQRATGPRPPAATVPLASPAQELEVADGAARAPGDGRCRESQSNREEQLGQQAGQSQKLDGLLGSLTYVR